VSTPQLRNRIFELLWDLLYRWLVGLGADEPVWVPTVFTKNRERLLQAEVAHKFLAELLNHKEVRGLLSDEPPSRGRNGERDFHGDTRSNDKHAPMLASIVRAKARRPSSPNPLLDQVLPLTLYTLRVLLSQKPS
jgi:hypothetical protein